MPNPARLTYRIVLGLFVTQWVSCELQATKDNVRNPSIYQSAPTSPEWHRYFFKASSSLAYVCRRGM